MQNRKSRPTAEGQSLCPRRGLGKGPSPLPCQTEAAAPGMSFRHPGEAAGAHGLVGAWTDRRSQLHVTWRHGQCKSLSRGSITRGRGRPHWLASCRGWPVADGQCERAREAGERCAHGCPRWAASAAVYGPGAQPVGTPLWESQWERVEERPPRALPSALREGAGPWQRLGAQSEVVPSELLGQLARALVTPRCSSLRCPTQLLSRQGVAPASLF